MGGRKQRINPAGKHKPAAKDIAEELGISISTVSRALSPNSPVSEKTRKKILAHAEEIGYRPNPFAKSLITRRTRIATIIISDIYNPFFPEVLTTLTQELQDYGLTVILFHVPEGKSPDEVLPEVLQYQPEYVVLVTATVSFQRAIAETSAGTHLIFFNRYVPATNTFSVTCDNREAGREVANFLIDTGHRNMAYIAGTPGATTSIDRGRGFAQRCHASGISVIQDNQAESFSYEEGRDGALRLLKSNPSLDAIFCANDLVALGAIDGIRYELHMRVPEDVSIVGFDDVAMASWPSHSLTTYQHPGRQMVKATVDLIRQIDVEPDTRPVSIKIPGRMIIRNTHLVRNNIVSDRRSAQSVANPDRGDLEKAIS